MGTLRFDLNNLTAQKEGGAAQSKELFVALEKLGFTFRLKSPEKAAAAYSVVADLAAAIKASL